MLLPLMKTLTGMMAMIVEILTRMKTPILCPTTQTFTWMKDLTQRPAMTQSEHTLGH